MFATGLFGATSLTHYGITWTFDGDYETGRFCNGDYWVAGPMVITGTTHETASGVIDGQETSVINPRWGREHAWDSRDNAGNLTYNPDLAVTFPCTVRAGDALVTVTHRITDREPWLADAAVLTAVSAAPETDAFRPPVTRPSRFSDLSSDPLLFTSDSIRWDLLPSRTRAAGMPVLSATEDKIRRPWVMNIDAIEGNRFIPANNMEGYGRDFSRRISEAAVQLCGDYTQPEKQDLCIFLIQAGIDIYGYCLDGGRWLANGGHMSGRKFPLIFAGLMLGNDDMTGIDRTSPDEPDLSRFQEDDQTYFFDDPDLPEFTNTVTRRETSGPADSADNILPCRGVRGWIGKLDGGEGAMALWRIDNSRRSGAAQHYEHAHIRHWGDDRESSYGKADSYRRCCNVSQWIGTALLLRLMGTEAVAAWNHDAWFDYCWRWMSESDSLVKPLWDDKYPGSTYPDIQQMHASDTFVTAMWRMHGASLPPLRADTGIRNPSPAGPVGRTTCSEVRYRLNGTRIGDNAGKPGVYLETRPGGRVMKKLILE